MERGGLGIMRYLIIVERGETGTYGAYCPDLPGCVAVGDTLEETLQLMKDAIPFHIRGLIEDGLEVPAPSSRAEYIEYEEAS
jgi:predicted RNase H-like HicB family nuclease